MAKPTAPTGISADSYGDSNRVWWTKAPETDVKGYNTYYSTTSGGGTSGYIKLNTTLVQTHTESRDEVIESSTSVSRTAPDSVSVADEKVTTITVKNIRNVYYFSYLHENLGEDREYYYVVTAVNRDGEESPYSTEVRAKPLVISVDIPEIPIRSEDDIVVDLIDTINRKDTNIDLKPGTTIRDLHIDPFGHEMELAYIRSDFSLRAQSFLTLLKLDDEDSDGESDLVSDSETKQKLKLAYDYQYDYEVQDMIDFAFDMLATNANIFRKDPEKATGEVVFYTTATSLDTDITIPIGTRVSTKPVSTSSAINFVTTVQKTLYKDLYSSYYNSINQRYEISVSVEAETAGEEGNVAAGTVIVPSGVDLLVTNESSMANGTEKESNISLANRAILAFTSIDVGTARGYKSAAIATSGVSDGFVVSAGDSLMMRDWDEIRQKHVYGKVDVFIDGEQLTEYTESFNFSYNQNVLEQFIIVDATDMRVKCTNSNVAFETPIYSVETVRNVNLAQNYNLEGMVIETDGLTIDLNESDPQNAAIGMVDGQVIRVTYKYRDADPLVLTYQPAREVASVYGTNSGILLPGLHYTFFRVEDPLLEGNSQDASYYVKIYYADLKPTGDVQEGTENIQLIDFENTSLSSKSIDENTIVIKTQDGLSTYVKNLDYIITSASYTDYVKIRRSPNSSIVSDETVKVEYDYGEEIVITYTVNDLVNIVQTNINTDKKHVTADVLVKEVVYTPIDIKISVVMKNITDDPVEIINEISTEINDIFNGKKIGGSLTQSEIIEKINALEKVKKCVVPLDKLIKADNSFAIRENLDNADWQVYQSGTVDSFTTGSNFLLHNTTGYNILDGFFWGVYEDDVLLTMVDDADSVKDASGQSFVSSDGSVIISPSDAVDPDPTEHVYDVMYIIFGETGANDITVSNLERIRLNSLQISIIR